MFGKFTLCVFFFLLLNQVIHALPDENTRQLMSPDDEKLLWNEPSRFCRKNINKVTSLTKELVVKTAGIIDLFVYTFVDFGECVLNYPIRSCAVIFAAYQSDVFKETVKTYSIYPKSIAIVSVAVLKTCSGFGGTSA